MTEEFGAEPKAQRDPLWKLILKIGVSALLVFVIIRMLDLAELARVFGNANWTLVSLAFALFLMAQVLRTVRWHLLIVCQKPGVSFLATFNAMFVGLFFNMFLPAELGGDVVRGLWLDKAVGSRSATFASVLADRILGMLTMALLAAWAIVTGSQHTTGSTTLLVAGLCVALLLFTAIASSERVARLIASLPIFPKRLKVADRLLRFSADLRVYRGEKRAVAWALFWSLLFQAAVYVSYWVLAQGLGLEAPMWSFFAFVPLITIITMVPASLNGIGAREMGYAYFFKEVGLNTNEAVALSLASYAFLVAASLVGGLVYMAQKRTT